MHRNSSSNDLSHQMAAMLLQRFACMERENSSSPHPGIKQNKNLCLWNIERKTHERATKQNTTNKKPHTIQEIEYNTHSLEWNHLPQKWNHPTIIKLHTSHHHCNSNQPLARHQQTHLIKEIIFSLNLTYRANIHNDKSLKITRRGKSNIQTSMTQTWQPPPPHLKYYNGQAQPRIGYLRKVTTREQPA